MTQTQGDRLDRVERILEQIALTQATEQQARLELQQTVQQNAAAISALRQEVSDSVADIIGIIDYAMDQMKELIRKSLNPIQNGNNLN
jgi:tRNA U34 5-carboxymethylaminomethyl modifying GTPase MnmE/TrmE